MIKEEKVEILITRRNITHFRNLGYDVINNKELEVFVKDLSNNSRVKITAVCNICGSENIITYEKYLKNKGRLDYYGCKKCSRIKAIKTTKLLYGVDNYMKLDECKEKISNNNIQKYGVKTTLLVPTVIEKIRKTNKIKYGSEDILSSTIIREKSKKNVYRKIWC